MSNPINQSSWNSLIKQIEKQQCVLVIGPDLVSYPDGQTLFKLLCEKIGQSEDLKDHVETSLKYGFEHEELLQLKSNAQTDLVYDVLEEFYQERSELDEPFHKIAQLPFHLIVSLFPDKRLNRIFDDLNQPYDFNYFSRTNGVDITELNQIPTKDRPLIYNILGVLDNEEAVFTFDNLFEYLQNILFNKPSSLPDKLIRTLDNAKSFLFLGVHFEKWYMQVLLRIFLPQNTRQNQRLKYSILKNEKNPEAFLFIAERLELDFLPSEPLEILEELFTHFSEMGLLKKKRTVFLSYSHQDKSYAQLIQTELENNGCEVIVDDVSMPAGEKISRFMETVKTVDKVLVILSKNSLKSPFVSKEMSLSLQYSKPITPCHLDDSFVDKDFLETEREVITNKIKELNLRISKRIEIEPSDSAQDLKREINLWQESLVSFGKLIRELQDRKSIALQDNDLEQGIKLIKESILS